MIGLSSVIGRPVLSLATSCIIGSVSDVYFDANCKKAVYFYIQQPLKNESALLPIESASSVSDAVTVGDESALVALGSETYKRGLKNMPVYTQTGALKGTLSDVLFTPAGKVAKLVCGDWEFTPSSISSIGDVILLKNAVKPVANRKKRKALIPRPETDYPVYILDGDRDKSTAMPALSSANPEKTDISAISSESQSGLFSSANAAEQPAQTEIIPQASAQQSDSYSVSEARPAPAVALSADNREPVLSNGAFRMILDGSEAYSYDEDSHTPTRVICDYEFLLGRTLGADLRTYTGELIATEGSAVSDAIVEKARRAGKLVELTLNSVKPAAKKRESL